MRKTMQAIIFISTLFITTGSCFISVRAADMSANTANAPPGRYALIAWNDLGMHCMDNNYSIFAILPPYNNLHAQLIDRLTGRAVTSDVIVTYEATMDTHGSINTTSVGKTDFWDWAFPLFGAALNADMGLAGTPVQSLIPAPLSYDLLHGYWKADGIPATPYDDAGNANFYPMVKVTAKDRRGAVLAITKTVLPVSDELACNFCHTSGTGDPAAQPSPDWVYDQDPKKDWKRNILLLHDNRNMVPQYANLYAAALAANGYSASGLLATADSGHPILCANCHASNALGTKGLDGIKQLTTSIHSWHAVKAMDDNTGMPLGDTMDRSGCYYCHPGSTTQCLRGVMGIAKNPDGSLKLECQSCHGSMYQVGADGRQGWIDLPKCQNCHYKSTDGRYVRDTSALDSSGNFKQGTGIFSTGGELYKLAATHGKMQCESCHGSTHAEYAASESNDNVQSILLQGYAGAVAECSACHLRELPISDNGGPHGLHTIGQIYVFSHIRAAKANPKACTICHGKDYRGGMLSKAFTDRSFFTAKRSKKVYAKGDMVGCYDCHNGPRGK